MARKNNIMHENVVNLNQMDPVNQTENDFFRLPAFLLLSSIILPLVVLGSFTAPESQMLFKTIFVALLIAVVFYLSLKSLPFLIYFYTGCAVINGISFLVAPHKIDNKMLFSNLFILLGKIKIYIPDLLLMVGLVVLILHFLTRNKQTVFNFYYSKTAVFLFVFIAAGLVIVLQSVGLYGKSALGESRLVWFSMLFFISCACFRSEAEILEFFSFFVKVSFIRAIIDLATVFIRPEYLDYQKPFGSGTDAAYFGLSLLLILVWGELCINSLLLRKCMIFTFALSILLIASRSSMLAFAVAIGVYLIMQKRPTFKNIVLTCFVTLFIAAIVIFFAIKVPEIEAYLSERFIPLFQDPESDPTGSWRLIGWAHALISICEHPIVGIGFGSYSERFIAGQWLRLSLHSAYVDILYSMGLIGLIPFCMILVNAIRQMYRRVVQQITDLNRKLCLSLLLIIVYLAFFISLNAEMSYALSGTLMWVFLGMVPLLCDKVSCKFDNLDT